MPAELREGLLVKGRRLFARREQILIASGLESDEVFYILSGTVQVIAHSADGKEMILRELTRGSLVGEFAAIDGQPRSANVVAKSDLELVCLTATEFRGCLRDIPGAGLWMAQRLTEEIRRLTGRLLEMATLPVVVRLHCELLRLCRKAETDGDRAVLVDAPTHLEIAARIGTHRETVTRELRHLAEQKILQAARRRITVTSLSALERLVERGTGLPPWAISFSGQHDGSDREPE